MHDPQHLVRCLATHPYRFEEVIAESAGAVVYKATHLPSSRIEAVKVFRGLEQLDSARRDAIVQRLVHAVSIVSTLRERDGAICAARALGTITYDGEWLPYVALEWQSGVTLEALLYEERESSVPTRTMARAVALLAPIAKALALAHRRGVAHLSVKPANILVVRDDADVERVKLLDFSVAKIVDDVDGDRAGATRRDLSVVPRYLAPEQRSPEYGPPGPRADVYALALLFVELVSNRAQRPSGAMPIADAHATFRVFGAHLPLAVEAVLQCALSANPQDRFANAQELWSELTQATAQTQVMFTDPIPSYVAASSTAMLPPPPSSDALEVLSSELFSDREGAPCSTHDLAMTMPMRSTVREPHIGSTVVTPGAIFALTPSSVVQTIAPPPSTPRVSSSAPSAPRISSSAPPAPPKPSRRATPSRPPPTSRASLAVSIAGLSLVALMGFATYRLQDSSADDAQSDTNGTALVGVTLSKSAPSEAPPTRAKDPTLRAATRSTTKN